MLLSAVCRPRQTFNLRVMAKEDVPRAHIRKDAEAFYTHFSGDRVLVELSPYDLNRGRIT